MGGSHDHSGGGDLPALAPGLRRGITVGVAVVAALAILGVGVWWPRGDAPNLYGDGNPLVQVDATVESVVIETCPGLEVQGSFTDCQNVEARVTSGNAKGDAARFVIYATDFDKPALKTGDEVVLVRNQGVPDEVAYSYLDFQRTVPLMWLGLLFVVVVIVLGRWKGVRALAGIVMSFGVLIAFLLPSLLRGNPALPVALAATVLIAFVALYLAHGVNMATTVALVGTLTSLAIIAVLAHVFVGAAQLTGLADDDAQVLRVTADAVSLRGLLVAGIVVGALGVLDDVTVTQVSVVAELRRSDPAMGWRRLYGSAVSVGRDHIASTVNTLVLAYAGASLPLLILFLQADQPWFRVLASEVVAIEIVRTLIGSIGLVLAVPVTTLLAAVVLTPPRGTVAVESSGWSEGSPGTTPASTGVDFSPEEKPF